MVTGISICCFSQDTVDSVSIDKKKIEQTIRKIKARPELKKSSPGQAKDFDIKDVTFIYPDKILEKDEFFDVEVKWKGEIILIYGVSPKTYELEGEIVDLR